MNAEQLKARIEKLMRKAESGADWAEICRLEAEYVALTGEQVYV